MDLFGYEDGFRILHPQVIEFTLQRPHITLSRLDRAYMPGHLRNLVLSVEHFPLLFDHRAPSIRLDAEAAGPTPRPEPTYWKLNTSVLQDVDVIPNFTRLLPRTSEYDRTSDWWEELFKPSVKRFLIQFSTFPARARKGTKSMLFSILDLFLDDQDWEEVAYIKSRAGKRFLATILAKIWGQPQDLWHCISPNSVPVSTCFTGGLHYWVQELHPFLEQ